MIRRFLNLFSNKSQAPSSGLSNHLEPKLPQVQIINYTSELQLTDVQVNAFIEAEINYRLLNGQAFDIAKADKLLADAARIIVIHQQGSTSLLQRKLKLGYLRCGKIIDQLEELGIVGPFDGMNARPVYISKTEDLELVLNGKLRSLSPEREYFNSYILPSKLTTIEHRVAEIKLAKQQEQTELVKAQIRNEFLAKEEQKKEEHKLQELKQQVLKEMIANGEITNLITSNDRMPIPQAVKDMVWNRDGGRCVMCGGNEKLEFDHIIPHAKGGAATYRNIQLLCEPCNRSKSDKIGL